MLPSDLKSRLPSSDELVDSDDFPVDNEEQNFIPNVLLFLLEHVWKHRNDWFFAVDMGVYHTTGAHPKVPVVPDGFLSLGVERRKGSKARKSYITWEENGIPPILALEVVSQTPGGEYDEKLEIYARLGVLYYIVYNPQFWRRDGHLPFEVYRLVNDVYELQVGEPFWMPEIGLGVGRCRLPADPLEREVLSWYDSKGDRWLSEAEAERQRADAQQQRADQLAERLRQLGEEI
ncbi:MAG: Uma2 family endonuclease [Drouetiella hepatica Uher 2000/2452]|jgi:Uma2 family endonuclease|uniref:Uma2 family endonuclease n=1 Tax=Drouetiella hepatica Uher 2000/2452 TaxID=904376 RepID=A0A951Q8B4_9CYAN|nr:Uma2 family endonuclease [Drouetiella hepatica Uher 2000/2452]